jgi:multiple sugar transport system substrate-binding protein
MNLSGITWDHPRGYDCLVAASETYRAQTGIGIAWAKRSLQAFADAPIADMAETYDFIVLDHPHVGLIADTGALLALSEPEDPSASIGGSAESYLWHDRCWAYAIDASCQMAVCRPDLLNSLPETWENLTGPEGGVYRPLTPLLPVDAFDMMMTLVASRGEEHLPFSARSFVSDKNGHYALDVLKGLYRLGPQQAVEMNPISVLETLSDNDDFACSPCLFGYANYARKGFRNKLLLYFDLPLASGYKRRRSILGGAGIGISARTSEPEAAIEFARWVSSEPVQSGTYLENEGQPANRHTWEIKRNSQEYSGFFGGAWNTMTEAWTRPRDAWFLGFVDDVCEIFPAFFTKDQTVETFLARLNSAYRHHIRGA